MAGLLLGLPVIIGTTLAFTIPQGREAVGRLSVAALYGLIPLAMFLVCVGVLSLVARVSGVVSLVVGLVVWLGIAGLTWGIQH